MLIVNLHVCNLCSEGNENWITESKIMLMVNSYSNLQNKLMLFGWCIMRTHTVNERVYVCVFVNVKMLIIYNILTVDVVLYYVL